MIKQKALFISRIILEVFFLALFVFMFVIGKIEMWFLLFAGGVLVSLVFSRFFCGWVCPMNTLFRPIRWIFEKMKINRFKIPRFMKLSAIRYLFLALFVGTMVVVKILEVNFPPLVIITGIAVFITLFFDEALWHNSICPFGTIFHISSLPAVKSVKIDETLCNSCGRCQKVCPSAAIDTLDTKKRRIRKSDCLTCHSCEHVCMTNAIRYR